ncbi:MAG: DNA methyltransferase, partial [Bryobacterales bacterium]|nr:DNA methyltransferase [Bryobacterales bacterium]
MAGSDRFGRLVDLLRELFQLDKPDLDFGFYRIMHAKEGEVTRFLERDLLPQVKQAFEQYQSVDRKSIEKKLAALEAKVRDLGVDPDTVPKVIDLRKALETGTDIDALEADVYDHLYRFFRRYYSEGDFTSQRTYKDGTYAIPYAGEEVKLYWANADQYYIKTMEYLKDYSFRLRPEDEADPMRVHFCLADATEGEHGNIKAEHGKARHFVLAAEDFIGEEGPDGVPELAIWFEYRAVTLADWSTDRREGRSRPPKQKDLNEAAETRLLSLEDRKLVRWMKELSKVQVRSDGTKTDYSRLRAHLNRYTARNTCDYFIHKDLNRFLRRELDFYIKNNVMHLDDIEHENASRVEEWLSKIKVIRGIAHKIIDFLAQLEGFQKKLWLKRKFVVATSYCLTMRCIPEEFHAEIAANRAQHDEWVELHGIDNFADDLVQPRYSDPLTVEFLRGHPTLMVDTRHFGKGFTEKLLEALGEIDELTDGVLFHSENSQALRLMERRYRGQVDCVYVDPPYNTDASEILYKNGYRHSSWLSLMAERIALGGRCLAATGTQITAIDDTEATYLRGTLPNILPSRDHTVVVVNHHPAGAGLEGTNISATHEYAVFSTPAGEKVLHGTPKNKDEIKPIGFMRTGTAVSNLRVGRPNSFYAVLVDTASKTVVGAEEPPVGSDYPTERTPKGLKRIYPLGKDGTERVWRRSFQSCVKTIAEGNLIYKGGKSLILSSPPKSLFKPILSNWYDKKYNAGVRGTNLLKDVLGANRFSYPKSVHTVEDCVASVTRTLNEPLVLDYFAGSGTTAHAAINLWRKSEGGGGGVFGGGGGGGVFGGGGGPGGFEGAGGAAREKRR